MSGLLAARQQALLKALSGACRPVGIVPLAAVELQRGLQAYQVNAQVLSERALAAVYPKVRQIIGEASFQAMAWAFWRRHPPQQADLGGWGELLAGFLAAQDEMDGWLCDLARLEWAAHLALRAADLAFDSASLDLLASQDPARLRLQLPAGLSLLQVQAKAWSIWSGEATDESSEAVMAVLLWRQNWASKGRRLSQGDSQLLQALIDGRTLEVALQQTFAVDAGFDFSAWLQAALREGWLRGAARIIPVA